MRKTLLILAASVLLVLFISTACTAQVTSTPQAVASESASASAGEASAAATEATAEISEAATASDAGSQASAKAAAAATNAAVAYTDAVHVALGEYPNAIPIKCSLDYDNGVLAWEMDVVATDGRMYEVVVDAAAGTLLRARADDDYPEVNVANVTVGYEQAVQTALDANPDCTFESFEVDHAVSGLVVYEIELRNASNREIDVDVNAQTGEIVANVGAVAPIWDDDAFDDDLYDDDIYDDDDYDDYYANNTSVAVGHHQERHHAEHDA